MTLPAGGEQAAQVSVGSPIPKPPTHHLKAGGALVSGYPVTDPGAAGGTGVKTDDAENLPAHGGDMQPSQILKMRCHDRNSLFPD
jgi:hypothetical protein